MEALSNKVQYGVFPSSFMMNLVLDHFLKHDDIDGKLPPQKIRYFLSLSMFLGHFQI